MFWANTNTSSRELLTMMSRSLCRSSVVASSVLLLTVTASTPAVGAAASPALGSGISISLSSC